MFRTFFFCFLLLASVSAAQESAPEAPLTLRLDYHHTGSADTEIFSLDRLVIEPLPFAGNLARRDDGDQGKYRFEIRDAASGELIWARGFSSIYGEWETTAEASEMHRTFHESLRFPSDDLAPVRVEVFKRKEGVFQSVWTIEVDPQGLFTDRTPAETPRPPGFGLVVVEENGDPAQKVDLLLLGDGYTLAERGKFIADARRVAEALFSVEPFRSRRSDFNVWGLVPPARESGVSRPSTGIHRRSPVGATYDAFGSERYVLTFENRAWREIAAWAPYDFIEILVNAETYGGGGIFNLYATLSVDNDWADYLFIHEFAHHFAGLADEYYTSSVAYESTGTEIEPWEPNVTVHPDPEKIKWRDLLSEDVPLPTPWPKEEFEEHAAEIQDRRRRIRAENRPETEMSALFREQTAWETALFDAAEHSGKIGAFEGANYLPSGFYRPEIDCKMFSRNDVPFCAPCRRALEAVIELYADSPHSTLEPTLEP